MDLFANFCESFASNSFSEYKRALMLTLKDFEDIASTDKSEAAKLYHQYVMISEDNRFALIRSMMKHKISWRTLEFENLRITTEIGLEASSFHKIYSGSARFNDGIHRFEIEKIEVYETYKGLKLNTDSFNHEIVML